MKYYLSGGIKHSKSDLIHILKDLNENQHNLYFYRYVSICNMFVSEKHYNIIYDETLLKYIHPERSHKICKVCLKTYYSRVFSNNKKDINPYSKFMKTNKVLKLFKRMKENSFLINEI